jgi:hypothetical protein
MSVFLIKNGMRHVWSILDNAWVPESYWDFTKAEHRIQNLTLCVAIARESDGNPAQELRGGNA